MAKSKAKKLRDKQVREGKRNPENGRGTYALANLTTKTTKTKKEKLNQLYKKERQSRYGSDRENVVLYFCIPLDVAVDFRARLRFPRGVCLSLLAALWGLKLPLPPAGVSAFRSNQQL
ncbi:hypothetical protein [Sutcliffiella horikoshii]|uniref:hypothetical protein n=1 Tax=Sutcliffiella horikoshii TaxID=79883 RepID=UPI00385040E9